MRVVWGCTGCQIVMRGNSDGDKKKKKEKRVDGQ